MKSRMTWWREAGEGWSFLVGFNEIPCDKCRATGSLRIDPSAYDIEESNEDFLCEQLWAEKEKLA